jgi:lycopene beta-cyclase
MCAAKNVGILGAGVAGLSLARELLSLAPETSITFFDIRPRLPHPGRTFCFFAPSEQFAFPSPTAVWNTVTFRGANFERSIDVSHAPYSLLHGEDFFNETLQFLESYNVTFHWQCDSPRGTETSIWVGDQQYTFDTVIDASFTHQASSSLLWQSFAGMWIKTELPTFDSSRAIIMDILPSSAEAAVSFFYILPTSSTSALVEHTTFSSSKLSQEYHLSVCRDWVHENVSSNLTVERCEHGAIPMGLTTLNKTNLPIIGSGGGGVRPGTGYAFLAIQRKARHLARQIISSKPTRITRYYPGWLEIGDRLFLRTLRRAPLEGRAIMEQMLAKARSDHLISFLSDTSSFRETIAVWSTVPKQTMLKTLLCG